MTAADVKPVEELLQRLKVHDVDTHITEPLDLWTSRMASKWGDVIPHYGPDPATGLDCWIINGEPGPQGGNLGLKGLDAVAMAGQSEPNARLEWMDRYGVYSQVLYPNLLGFRPRAFMRGDRDFGIECVRAYNDFQTDFCSVAPDRLIPIANLPFWDLDAAIAELERCYAMGHKGLNFGWDMAAIGQPPLRDEHWAPLLERAQEMGWSVSFHVGFNSEEVDVDGYRALSKLDQATFAAKFFTGNIHCVAELIMGRICERYPRLKFVSVESGVGFFPYLLEALDWQFLNNNIYRDYPEMLLPSQYFRRQIFGCFWFEKDIVQLAELYPDNFMFETDFPHGTSLTPGDDFPYVTSPRETIIANMAEIPETTLVKLLHDNAASVYGLT
jgi:uncharacterized protein